MIFSTCSLKWVNKLQHEIHLSIRSTLRITLAGTAVYFLPSVSTAATAESAKAIWIQKRRKASKVYYVGQIEVLKNNRKAFDFSGQYHFLYF